jgi:hypothetical protein
MTSSAGVGGPARESAADHYKRDFWIRENPEARPGAFTGCRSLRGS